jgi:hypothetical protein
MLNVNQYFKTFPGSSETVLRTQIIIKALSDIKNESTKAIAIPLDFIKEFTA